jgi:hypothetical protein
MRHRRKRALGASAVELIERAFQDLRRAPAAAFAAYGLGTFAFLLALLEFSADMSSSAFAAGHVGESALALAVLYLVMKLAQTIFVVRLEEAVLERQHVRWNARRWLRAAAIQSTLQPAGLFLLPLSAVAVLPFGWAFAFWQSVTVLGDGSLSLREVTARAARSASVWPKQNHTLLVLPYLLRLLLGIESTFTRGGMSLFNSTFFGIALALTFALMGPVTKSVYRRRCFEARSVETGEDLQAEWRLAVRGRVRALPVVLALLFCAPFGSATAATTDPRAGTPPAVPSQPVASLAPRDLEEAIRTVLRNRTYAWRLPRDKPASSDEGWLLSSLRSLADRTRRVFDLLGRWWNDFWDRLRRPFRENRTGSASGSGLGWIYSTHGLALIGLAAATCALVLFWIRRRRRLRAAHLGPQPLLAIPEPDAESSSREELPDAEWRNRALLLASRGELRLAARAFYLGMLALLAARGSIVPARGKSNRDYQREVARRERDRAAVPELFGETVATFEQIWYGHHPATPDSIALLDHNLDHLQKQLGPGPS